MTFKKWSTKLKGHRRYEENKGKKCKNPLCKHIARAKGFCQICYTNEKNRIKRMEHGFQSFEY